MENICMFSGCDRVVRARGLCGKHYQKFRRGNPDAVNKGGFKWVNSDGTRMDCRVPECPYVVETQGMCSKHYQQFHYESTRGATKTKKNRKNRDITGAPLDLRCTFEGCSRKEFNPGLCAGHYYQKLKTGVLRPLHERLPCPVRGCEDTYSALKGKNNVCIRHSALGIKYNLSEKDLVTLLEPGVCSNPGCGSAVRLHVDHDHNCCPYDKKFPTVTQKSCGECVRGILCSNCNSALGMLKENPRAIRGLLEYLERF